MNRALEHSVEKASRRAGTPVAKTSSWGSRMSDHVAYALLVYTGLQIFVTMLVLKSNHASILPYFALIVLVVAIIPACRMFEMRWSELPEEQSRDPRLAGAFARDKAIVWLAAILLPLVIAGLIKGLSLLFG